jgi:hypothetical protein
MVFSFLNLLPLENLSYLRHIKIICVCYFMSLVALQVYAVTGNAVINVFKTFLLA